MGVREAEEDEGRDPGVPRRPRGSPGRTGRRAPFVRRFVRDGPARRGRHAGRSDAAHRSAAARSLADLRLRRLPAAAAAHRGVAKGDPVTRRLALLVAAILGAGPAFVGQQRPVFLTTADLVTIDVAVRSRNTPVAGLKAEDFEVFDNGVRQQVEMLDATSLPIDLTVVLDVSGSMLTLVGPMTKYANTVLDMLQADDRLRIIKVGTYVSQPVGFSRATGQLEVAEIEPGEMTSLYDGLAAAMMRSRTPDRRHVIV